jgi:hypothetical protein
MHGELGNGTAEAAILDNLAASTTTSTWATTPRTWPATSRPSTSRVTLVSPRPGCGLHPTSAARIRQPETARPPAGLQQALAILGDLHHPDDELVRSRLGARNTPHRTGPATTTANGEAGVSRVAAASDTPADR